MNPHNFIANQRDAKYPTICSKCGLGLDRYTTPTPTNSKRVPPCPYEDKLEVEAVDKSKE